jgi:hypothetical protein
LNFQMTTRDSFVGLNILSNLIIRSVSSLTILNNPLFYLSETLNQLIITHVASTWDIIQLFKRVVLNNIKTVDFRNNNFPQLNKSCFTAIARKVEILYLLKSKIQLIEAQTFDDFENIRELYLQENELKILPENIFNSLLSLSSFNGLALRENQWICDCDILHLQKKMIEYQEKFIDKPYCRLPENLNGTFIIDLEDICVEETDDFTDIFTFSDITFSDTSTPGCDNSDNKPPKCTSTTKEGKRNDFQCKVIGLTRVKY